ncbi:deacetylase-like protein [Thermocrinis albus DSM 14484]|uniref:Deacetylase-like protein n=1 Tax=Thermocrinis albus (strain DSM 14484 / JCM 11386 / HI 11/12) TaxID=638303 RepID=D3SMT5_THEAH|nr:polysaccharide deacetylase family protein [Thermocrinis albus]ADC90065.1 deacetylase-like protein [Thermocrinis albus DSM 14484]
MLSALVELHDVTPHYEEEIYTTLHLLKTVGVRKFSLLVIPNFQGRYPIDQFQDWVSFIKGLGQEVVIHGFTHSSPFYWQTVIKTYREGEFFKKDLTETYRSVEKALDIMQKVGLHSKVFVPPAWIDNPYLEDVLYAFGIRFLGLRKVIKDLETNREIHSSSLTFANRYVLSFVSILAMPSLLRRNRSLKLIRLAIHAKDMRDKRKITIWRWVLNQVKKERRFVSYEEIFSESGHAPSLPRIQHARRVVERSAWVS